MKLPPKRVSTIFVTLFVLCFSLGFAGVFVLKLLHQSQRFEIPQGATMDLMLGRASALDASARNALVTAESARLRAEPLDSSALVNLAILKKAAGDNKAFETFLTAAAAFSLHDPAPQIVAAQGLLAKGDFKGAVSRIDGLFVANPGIASTLYPSIRSMLPNADFRFELAKVLTEGPPWRQDFIKWNIENDISGDAVPALFASLHDAGGGYEQSELTAYLAHLMAHQNYEKAYFVWLDSLNADALKRVGNVFDGGFDLTPKNQFFDWNVLHMSGAEIVSRSRNEDGMHRELGLNFVHTTEAFGHVYQYLRLLPGHYRLNGTIAAREFRSPGGLRWNVACVETGGLLASSGAWKESTPLQTFTFEFAVPEQCPTQILRLASASPAALDAALDGEIMFRDIGIINPETAGQSKQP